MSILQFVSCLVALAGGMWLGATYVGLDLKKTAERAITESEIAGQGAGRLAAGAGGERKSADVRKSSLRRLNRN